MDTTEIIHNALEWANKRLELQGEPITENQRNYIVFALRQQLTIPAVIGWVSVSDELPKEYKHRMSRDVLTIAGSKMSVKSYDWELGRWNGSPHITVTHWMELPSPPCR